MSTITTLDRFLVEQKIDAPLAALLLDVAGVCKNISATITQGAILGLHGAIDGENQNIQGETQKKLDVIGNNAFIESPELARHLAGMASEEMEHSFPIKNSKGKYLLLFDPLDGSSNIEVNISIGTIFSVLHCPTDVTETTDEVFLQPGVKQVCAGYALYGPSTMIVLTTGKGVHGFTLDPASAEFVLTHRNLRVAEDTVEFAINASNERFWEPPVRRYINECVAGKEGPRGRNFNTRWVASMVAEVHRILMRGGIFMYPRDYKDLTKPGRLRLMYEANPMAMIIEQAGGAASTGRERILDVSPTGLHQRIAVIIGSRNEVERIDRYYTEHAEGREPVEAPLLKSRSLFSA